MGRFKHIYIYMEIILTIKTENITNVVKNRNLTFGIEIEFRSENHPQLKLKVGAIDLGSGQQPTVKSVSN